MELISKIFGFAGIVFAVSLLQTVHLPVSVPV